LAQALLALPALLALLALPALLVLTMASPQLVVLRALLASMQGLEALVQAELQVQRVVQMRRRRASLASMPGHSVLPPLSKGVQTHKLGL
jgi:hypothetical protein